MKRKGINHARQVVWANRRIPNKSGGYKLEQFEEDWGDDLVEILKLEDITPNEWYLMRPNGNGRDYRPVYLSEHASYDSIVSFVKHGMLYKKKSQ
jgi:hypothetical protein